MKFFLNTNFIIEHGSSHQISDLIKENIGIFNKPALLYDAILEGQSHFNIALKKIKEAFPKIDIQVNDINGEPTYRYLNQLTNYFRNKNIDIVIAIGGGSTIDLGKGIAFLLNNKGNALKYKGFPKDVADPLPLVTSPSLFGSGADVSYNAVFIDEEKGKKLGINSTKNFPNLAIIDSELTMEAPLSVIISSAMDTLVHCIDSFGSVKHTEMSKMYSMAGFTKTFNVLLKNKHMSLDYRNDLALGSICGITALMNSGDGPTNGFAYYLGVKHNVPHGLAGAIFLKEVMNFNIYKEYTGYEQLVPSKTIVDLMNDFEKIYTNLDIPNLFNYGFKLKDMDCFIKESLNALSGSFAGNPIEFDKEAVEVVYKNLIMER